LAVRSAKVRHTVSCTDGSDEWVKCSALADTGTAGAPGSATLRINGHTSSAALKFSDGARSDVEEHRLTQSFCSKRSGYES